jgi:hypothetical protein
MATIHMQPRPSFVVPFPIVRRPHWRSPRHNHGPRRASTWLRRKEQSACDDDWHREIRAYDSHKACGDLREVEEVSG